MKTRLLSGCIALLVMPPLWAEEFKLANGQVVKGELSRVEPDGLVLMTETGVEKVMFLALPEETQKRFGFDLKKADEFRAQQTAARQLALEQQAAAIRERAKRLEFLREKQPSPDEQQRIVKVAGEAFTATATVLESTPTGARVRITRQVGRPAATMLDKDTRATVEVGEGFLYGLHAAEDEVYQGKLYPAGYHTFKTPLGEERTVRAYALTAEKAVEEDRRAGNGKILNSEF